MIIAMDEMRGVGLQAWVSSGEMGPSRESIEPLSDRGGAMRKPRGGFWTSTYDEHYGSGWIQWCLGESYDCDPDDPVFRVWILEPDPAARVYEVDTYSDVALLCEHYGETVEHGDYSETYPAWSRVARDYDAVHLTDDGQWATRFSDPGLYGWDCESTLWLRWAFTAVVDLGRVRYQERGDEDDEAVPVRESGSSL